MPASSKLSKIKKLPKELLVDLPTREKYAGDKWFARSLPDAVALPKDAASVAEILRFAYKNNIPVTPRGSGYGYVGGCVPVKGGIVLSLEKMNRIREIHAQDFVAVVEPGVLTADLQKAVEEKKLFYPPDPASRADSSIGGNIATNAGGPRCLKYGVTRDYVLGLDVVIADGTFLKLGSRTHKNKSGFDLHRLFVGSEGLLGVVTGATLKLLPKPPERALLSCGFASIADASRTIDRIFENGYLPCALEIADAFTLRAAEKRTGSKKLAGCDSILMVEIDGQKNAVNGDFAALETLIGSQKPVFIDKAVGAAECEKLWQVRREFSYALRDTGLTKLNEDITVPRGRLTDLLAFSSGLEKRFGFPVACFGHAGDGNIHVNVMVDLEKKGSREKSDKVLDALFEQIVAWGGVITGEHGIGLAKKPWWPLAASKEVRALHSRVKKALDPKGLLNPGKFV